MLNIWLAKEQNYTDKSKRIRMKSNINKIFNYKIDNPVNCSISLTASSLLFVST